MTPLLFNYWCFENKAHSLDVVLIHVMKGSLLISVWWLLLLMTKHHDNGSNYIVKNYSSHSPSSLVATVHKNTPFFSEILSVQKPVLLHLLRWLHGGAFRLESKPELDTAAKCCLKRLRKRQTSTYWCENEVQWGLFVLSLVPIYIRIAFVNCILYGIVKFTSVRTVLFTYESHPYTVPLIGSSLYLKCLV